MAKPNNAAGNVLDLFGIKKGEVINEPDLEAVWIERQYLERNPKQPRKRFDEEKLRELGDNLKSVGQIEPIIVRPHPESASNPAKKGVYQIVAGERRWRASAKEYGNLPRLRCIIRELNDVECLTISLSENANREDISPIEYAQGLVELKNSAPGCTWDSVLTELNIERRRLFQFTGLLELPQEAQDKIDSGEWNEKHGRALLEWKGNHAKQEELIKAIESEGLSGNAALKRAKALRVKVPAPIAPTASSQAPGGQTQGSGFSSGQSSDFRSSAPGGTTTSRSITIGAPPAGASPAGAAAPAKPDVVRDVLRPGVSFVAESLRVVNEQGIPRGQKREVENELQILESLIAQIRSAL